MKLPRALMVVKLLANSRGDLTMRRPTRAGIFGVGPPKPNYWKIRIKRWQIRVVIPAAMIGLLAAACGTSPNANATSSMQAGTTKMTEYVAGRWIPFSAVTPLSPSQWSVVEGYANFSSAALAVYTMHSVAALATVVSPQSGVVQMFTRDLATGKNPEALYIKAIVESVAIHGCRATIALELYYPGGRSLHYVSSWVRPFDPAGHTPAKQHLPRGATGRGSLAALESTQYAPWQFVGDNRVGGIDTPCGI